MLPSPHPKVVSQAVSQGGVLLHTEGEVYFGLNAVGMRIWQLLPPSCRTLEELCGALSQSYPEVPADMLRNDTVALLEELGRQGLVIAPATA